MPETGSSRQIDRGSCTIKVQSLLITLLTLDLYSESSIRLILVAGPDTRNLQGFSLRVLALPAPASIYNSKVSTIVVNSAIVGR